MRTVGPLLLSRILQEWGRHEASGRGRAEVPPEVLETINGDTVDGVYAALEFCLVKRRPLVARLLCGEYVEAS